MQPPTAARDLLISEHANTARRMALKMARRCPSWIGREDLVSAGLLGLTEAANRYDASRKEPFLSYAEHRIRGAILDQLRIGDLLPRRVRQTARKVSNAIRDLENAGEATTDNRIAMKLGVAVEHYRTNLAHLVHVDVQVFDELSPALRTGLEAAPDQLAARTQELEQVNAALAKLGARDVTILGLHYVEDQTYQEIARALGVTPSRVCQLLWRAVERMRALLGVTDVVVPSDIAAARLQAA